MTIMEKGLCFFVFVFCFFVVLCLFGFFTHFFQLIFWNELQFGKKEFIRFPPKVHVYILQTWIRKERT